MRRPQCHRSVIHSLLSRISLLLDAFGVALHVWWSTASAFTRLTAISEVFGYS